jgi:protein ImuA
MSSIAPLGPLRQALASIERNSGFPLAAEEAALPLGLPAIDAALGGGLAFGAVHEAAPAATTHLGAAFGFALAIVARAVRHRGKSAQAAHALWIETDYTALEGGKAYGIGLELFGLSLDRLLILRVARPLEALWAFEEALKFTALAAVIAELPQDGAAADLTATRRLSLAARAGNGLGLLLRHREAFWATSAMTRWQVGAAPSEPDRFGGLGRTAFDLSLTKNRRGRCGRFIVYWDHESKTFIPQALSLGLAETASDRSDHPQRLASVR